MKYIYVVNPGSGSECIFLLYFYNYFFPYTHKTFESNEDAYKKNTDIFFIRIRCVYLFIVNVLQQGSMQNRSMR